MNKIETFEQFLANQSGQISFVGFIINLLVAGLLSYFLSWIYVRYGRSLSNRQLFAQNFVVLTVTTMIIISIIKSSLALSLGLVGALSIIRFRSAIKEPEELTYIFICIAIGLGMGASQGLITVVGFSVVIAFVVFRSQGQEKNAKHNLHLTVSSTNTESLKLEQIVDTLSANADGLRIRRIDENTEIIEAAFLVEFNSFEQLNKAKKNLLQLNPSMTLSFLDNSGLV